jgi:hypothetical protein
MKLVFYFCIYWIESGEMTIDNAGDAIEVCNSTSTSYF